MSKKFTGTLLNILSGAAMCIGGAMLIIKGSTAEGIALVTAGVTKITAYEVQQKEVKNIKTNVDDFMNNGMLKNINH